MGAFDGYWVPRYGVLQRGKDDFPPRKVSGFYVSWGAENGGITGKWSDTKEEANALLAAMITEGKCHVAKWYEQEQQP